MSTIVSEKEKVIQEEKVDLSGEQFNLLGFIREVREEFLKISWPSRDQVTKEFFSVMVLVTVITSVIFVLDKIFGLVSDFFSGRLF